RTWEMALRGHPDAGSPDQGSFLVSLFGLVGITITFPTASKMSYAISYASLGGCALRLFVIGRVHVALVGCKMRPHDPFDRDVVPHARLGFAMGCRMVGSCHLDTTDSTSLEIQ
nr:hypothetical protein [Candidatus Poseidoniales archaeon]